MGIRKKTMGVAALFFIVFTPGALAEASTQYAPMPLLGEDIVSRLPQPVQNLIHSTQTLNQSMSTWTPPTQSFEGAGARFGETLRAAFRTFAFLLLILFSWLISAATMLVFWIAGIVILLMRWTLETVRVLP